MITKFNEYQKLLEDEMIQPVAPTGGGSWIDTESLNKNKILGFFKKKPKEDALIKKDETKPVEGVEGNQLNVEYEKLFTQTPIFNMSAKAYAKLNGLVQDDKEIDLDLDGNLDENSAMIDIAYKYYIQNISDVIISIQDTPTNYMVESVGEDFVVKLKNNPITIGTMLGNAINEWFSSMYPINSINTALNSAHIQPKENLVESYYELNEGTGTKFLTKLINQYQKVSKYEASSSSALGRSKFASAIQNYSPISRKSGMNLSSTLPKSSPLKSNSSITKTIEDKIKNISGGSKSGSFLSGKPTGSPRTNSIVNSIKTRMGNISSKVSNITKATAKNVVKKSIYYSALFFAPAFVMNKVLGEWLDFFESGKSNNQNAIDFMMVFEEDMTSRGYSPFSIYSNIAKDYEFNINKYGDNFKDILIGWCQSLYDAKIIDNQIFDTCQRQIRSKIFDEYLLESSNISKELSSELENKWKDNITFPTSGLTTFSTIVIFIALLEKFEDQFYEGRVPVQLPKQLTEIERVDKEGNPRNYLTIGDSGDDVVLLQDILKILGVYNGEVDGIYDEEMSNIIRNLKREESAINPDIVVDGNADSQALEFIDKYLVLKSGKVQGEIGGRISARKQALRSEVAKSFD
jgi:hypothetical protein